MRTRFVTEVRGTDCRLLGHIFTSVPEYDMHDYYSIAVDVEPNCTPPAGDACHVTQSILDIRVVRFADSADSYGWKTLVVTEEQHEQIKHLMQVC